MSKQKQTEAKRPTEQPQTPGPEGEGAGPDVGSLPACHEITRLKVADLLPWAGNPRTITEEALAGLDASIARWGLVQPIVFNKRTGRVLGGHQRLRVLQAHGVNETDVVVVDLPEVEERALNVALNNPHIAGGWAPEARDLLRELSTGFDAFKDLRLDELLDELGRTNLRRGQLGGAADEDEACEPPEEPETKAGDLWVLGPHRLLCGDSTDPAVLARLMDGAQADGAFTDPPYNVDYSPAERAARGGKRTGRSADPARGRIANDNLSPGEFQSFLVRAFGAMDPLLRPGAPIYVCAPAGRDLAHFISAWPDKAWHYQAALVWDKTRPTLSRWDYRPQHELVLYGWKRGAEHTWLGDRRQGSVIGVEMGSGRGYVHPTQKPVALVRRALVNSVPEDGAVIDTFGGSGSTLIAAETCGRRAFLCELDPRFVDAAVRRWERYTGQAAVRSGTAS